MPVLFCGLAFSKQHKYSLMVFQYVLRFSVIFSFPNRLLLVVLNECWDHVDVTRIFKRNGMATVLPSILMS